VQKHEPSVFAREPFPGFTGKRYWICDDSQYHLVMKVYEDGMTDVLCSENIRVLQPQPADPGGKTPMCKACVALHFGGNNK